MKPSPTLADLRAKLTIIERQMGLIDNRRATARRENPWQIAAANRSQRTLDQRARKLRWQLRKLEAAALSAPGEEET